jgi:DNA-directed RNA polymerase subunit K/omega
VVLSGLRAAQLMRGCIPKVQGAHKLTTTAQWEVASGKIVNVYDPSLAPRSLAASPDPAPALVAV